MNKVFFVVFLGVIAGAMALIFVNHTARSPELGSAVYAQKGASAPNVTPNATPGAAPLVPPVETAGERTVASARQPVTSQPGVPVLPGRSNGADRPAPAQPARSEPPARPAPVEPAGIPAPTARPETPARTEQPAPSPAQTPPPVQTPVVTAERPAAPAPSPVTPDPVPQASSKKSLTLRNIGLQFKNNGIALRIEADGSFSYKTFVLPSPDRYVVDLVGAWTNMRAPKVPPNMFIKAARAGSQPGGPRLVLDLQRVPRKHTVSWISPTVLEIYIE